MTSLLIRPQPLTRLLAMDGKRIFATLDALRAVAASCVVLYHLRVWFPQVRVLDHAYLAVDLFFILSGFVLAHAYGRDLGGALTYPRFLAFRGVRLFPLLILGAIFGLMDAAVRNAVEGHAEQSWSLPIWFALAVTSVPIPAGAGPAGQPFPLNWPAWSLFFELVMSAAFWLIARASTLRLAALAVVAGMALAAAAVHLGEITVKRNALFFLAGIPRAAFPFILGMLLHRLHVARKLPYLPMPGAVVCLVAFATFLPPVHRGNWNAIYDLCCVGLVYPLLVIAACARKDEPHLSGLAWFGRDLSYALYILHFPVAHLFVLTGRALGMPARSSELWYVLAAVGLVLATSYAAIRIVDHPIRRRLVRLLNQRRAPPGKPAPTVASARHGELPDAIGSQAGTPPRGPACTGPPGSTDRLPRDPPR